MKDTVVINDKNVEVEVTAYTMLIYIQRTQLFA